MRLFVISVILFFAVNTPLIAQNSHGNASATGALNGAISGSRTQLRSSGDASGRASSRIPSHRAGGERHVGANFDARSNTDLSVGDRRVRGRASINANAQALERRRREHVKDSPEHTQEPADRFEATVSGETNRHVLHADLHLAHRLAQIDRLRDHALANDDVDLLMRADILEQQARAHHQQHVEQMRVAAAQGRGQKRGFDVQWHDEHGAEFHDRAAQFDGQFEARVATYEEISSDESAHADARAEWQNQNGESQRPLRRPFRKRFIPGVDPISYGADRGAPNGVDAQAKGSGEFDQDVDEQPITRPRRTRVNDEEFDGELDAGFEGEGTVRAAEVNN